MLLLRTERVTDPAPTDLGRSTDAAKAETNGAPAAPASERAPSPAEVAPPADAAKSGPDGAISGRAIPVSVSSRPLLERLTDRLHAMLTTASRTAERGAYIGGACGAAMGVVAAGIGAVYRGRFIGYWIVAIFGVPVLGTAGGVVGAVLGWLVGGLVGLALGMRKR
jgi:hypothetical protein